MIVCAVLDGENHVKLVCEKEEAASNTAKRYGRGWHVRMFDTEYGDSFEDNALYTADIHKDMTKVRVVLCEYPEKYGLLKGQDALPYIVRFEDGCNVTLMAHDARDAIDKAMSVMDGKEEQV